MPLPVKCRSTCPAGTFCRTKRPLPSTVAVVDVPVIVPVRFVAWVVSAEALVTPPITVPAIVAPADDGLAGEVAEGAEGDAGCLLSPQASAAAAVNTIPATSRQRRLCLPVMHPPSM